MVDLEKIRTQILEGTPIETVLSGFDWSRFEAAVTEIFAANDFSVKRNFRFKTKRRYEIDIIASRSEKTVCVNCKEWREGRNKKSAVEKAAYMQRERAEQLEKFVAKTPIAQSSLKIGTTANRYVPMLVTLLEEDVKEHETALIVPVWKLNNVLNSDIF